MCALQNVEQIVLKRSMGFHKDIIMKGDVFVEVEGC